MLVKFLGFSLTPGEGIGLNTFFEHVAGISGVDKEWAFNGKSRILLVDTESNENNIIGLFVTIKDHKKFCELRQEDGKLRICVSEVDENSNLMDFNYFIVNKETGCGIYQHYHASCSMSQFMGFLRDRWRSLKEHRVQQDKQNLINAGKAEKAAERKAKRNHKGILTHQIYMRQEGLAQMMQQLSKIKSLEVLASTAPVPNDSFGPQNFLLKKTTQKFSFNSPNLVGPISGHISAYLQNNQITRGRVLGEDDAGLERVINLLDNADNFGEYDYDTIAGDLEVDLDDFQASGLTDKLIEAAAVYPDLFENVRN